MSEVDTTVIPAAAARLLASASKLDFPDPASLSTARLPPAPTRAEASRSAIAACSFSRPCSVTDRKATCRPRSARPDRSKGVKGVDGFARA